MSFQTASQLASILMIVVVTFVGLVGLSFPVLVVVSVRQVIERRKRNHRDRWARVRTLRVQQVVASASSRAASAPPVEAYPAPEELAIRPGESELTRQEIQGEVDVVVSNVGTDILSMEGYPDPEETE